MSSVLPLNLQELEQEIKQIIVDSLHLEDVKPTDIDTEAPLFVEGLRLDSIDALELGMALRREYDVEIKADEVRNREIFSSVRSLAAFVAEERNQRGQSDDA